MTVDTGLPLTTRLGAIAPKRLDRRWLARRAARLDPPSPVDLNGATRISALVQATGNGTVRPVGNTWRVISRVRPADTIPEPGAEPVAKPGVEVSARTLDMLREIRPSLSPAIELPELEDDDPALSIVARSMAADAVVAPERGVRTAELFGALSRALDMAEGREPRHAMRTAYVAMRLADALHLSDGERLDIFYAALLKDVGSTANAAATARVLGTSDLEHKRDLALVDERNPLAYARFCLDHLPTDRAAANAGRLGKAVLSARSTRHALHEARAERGADVIHRLGLPMAVSEAVHALRERWDGHGEPLGNRGHEIPIAARVVAIAEGAALFAERLGPRGAERAVRARRRKAYDPELVDLLLGMGRLGLWREILASNLESRALSLEPDRLVRISRSNDIDRTAAVFADVIDAKSPYTARHSLRVGNFASLAALHLGVDEPTLVDIRRAGLLHDIGNLAVPNTILDKSTPLTAEERAIVARHPQRALEILSRVPLFGNVAKLAACHHERLDGSGYPRGLRGEQLTLGARILAAADIFEALTSTRPQREAMSAAEALEILDAAAGAHVSAEAVAGLRAIS